MSDEQRAQLVAAVLEALERRGVPDEMEVREAVRRGIQDTLHDLGIGDGKAEMDVGQARDALRWAVTRRQTEQSIGARAVVAMAGGLLVFLGAALVAGLKAMMQQPPTIP